MLAFAPLDAATGVAYHLVDALAGALAPAFGTGATAAAVVCSTAAVRLALLPLSLRALRGERARAALAPRLAELRERHRDDPARLSRAVLEAYRGAGAGPFAGVLPRLLQAPVFLVWYRLFASPVTGAGPNALLERTLAGVPLGQPWAAGGLVGAHDWVFVALLAVLTGLAWWSARRMGQAPWLLRLLPYGTVALAATVPLAAGLYLATTTAWSAAESAVLRRGDSPAAGGGGVPPG